MLCLIKSKHVAFFSSLLAFFKYQGKVRVDPQAVRRECEIELLGVWDNWYTNDHAMLDEFYEQHKPMAKINSNDWREMLANLAYHMQPGDICRDCAVASRNVYCSELLVYC